MTPMSSTAGGGGGGGGGLGFAAGFFFEVPALVLERAGFEPAGAGFFNAAAGFLSAVAGALAAAAAIVHANASVHAAANAAATGKARDRKASMAPILRAAAHSLTLR